MQAEHVAFLSTAVIAVFTGAYVTSLLCRSGRKFPHWYWAAIGTIVSVVLSTALLWLGLSVGHGDFGKGTTVWAIVFWVATRASACALVAALLTLMYYRQKHAHEKEI